MSIHGVSAHSPPSDKRMKVAGLFVGVSRLADPRIPELRFAHSDATTLHAIFADANLEQQAPAEMCRLVVNGDATKQGVLAALAGAIEDARSGRADLVVVHFSCHGSPSGAFVLHDTDAATVDATGQPVHEVIDMLSQVRDRPVILTLDCCFAGTAIGLTGSPNREAFNELMHRDQDQSRVVGCAAEFGQSAFEDMEYGHGFFSHALATRLQEARDAGDRQMDAFEWVNDAVGRTTELARTRGRSQAAVAFVTTRETRAMLRLAPRGPHQLRLIVPTHLPPVTDDVGSLAGQGIDAATIAAIRARLGPDGTLNELQRQAIEVGGVLRHQSVFVRAPTSAGKTLVAELAILGHQRTGRKSVVLLPLRALAREHASTFRDAYSQLGLRVIVSTGDAHDDDDLLIRGQFEVAFLTFEKFCAVISVRPDLQEALGLVVFDELQTISDVGRGHTLELLLVQVRRWRTVSLWPQLVVLCGELADLGPLQRWLNLPVIASRHRPVPLEEAVLRVSTGEVRLYDREQHTERIDTWPDAVARPGETIQRSRRRTAAAPVIKSLLAQGKQVLVFCSEKRQARLMAQLLARSCGLGRATQLLTELDALDPTTEHRTRTVLREIAGGGVGLHVADLADGERNAVEDAFRRRDLKVVVATSTLSQGVNLPADAVVFVDTERWHAATRTDEPISVVDYRNTAGRAGRLIPDGPSTGVSLLIAQTQHSADEMWDRYVASAPAELGSSLGDLPIPDRVLLLLRQFESATVNDLAAALSATYWATTQRVGPTWRTARRREMESSLEQLLDVGLVARVGDTGWKLTPVGHIAAGYGLSWRSGATVSTAARYLREARERVDGLALIVLALVTDEARDCWCPRGHTAVPDHPGGGFAERPVLWGILTAEADGHPVGDRLHKLEAINKWVTGVGLREVESFYARGDDDIAAAGQLLHLMQRVGAHLPAIAAIASLDDLDLEQALRQDVRRLRAQLHIGGGRHAAALHRLRLGLTRGQCLALARLGIHDLSGLRDAVANRREELAPVLSTPGLQRVTALMCDRRHYARISVAEPQLALEGFN